MTESKPVNDPMSIPYTQTTKTTGISPVLRLRSVQALRLRSVLALRLRSVLAFCLFLALLAASLPVDVRASSEAFAPDVIPPYVVDILRGAKPNPTNKSSVDFWVYFNETVSGVEATDFSLTANGVVGAAITSVSYNGRYYRVYVNTGAGNGDIRLDLSAAATIQDLAGNAIVPGGYTAGEVYIVDKIAPEVILDDLTGMPGGIAIRDWKVHLGSFTSLRVYFSEDMMNPEGSFYLEDVTNPYNYMLIQPGTDGYFDTLSCEAGRKGDDIYIYTGPVRYTRSGGTGPFIASVTVQDGVPLSRGIYRLFICGTTSLQDKAGNPINDGADEVVTFTIGNTSLLPATGFAPGRQTEMPAKPAEKAYSALGDIWLEIPTQGVKAPIVGVPGKPEGWDTLWLEDQIGWLEGTAFPSWQGNAVLTAHVYGYNGKPGPFVDIKNLAYNDQVIVHVYGQQYIFAVRTSQQVRPQDTRYAYEHVEGGSYLTLITCQSYDPTSNTYSHRRVVRLVLVGNK